MSAEQHETGTCEVSEAGAKAELDRLLSDHRFNVTDRHRAILKYLAEQFFSGRREGTKAYSIAVDVLGKPCNFESTLDPIVRIELSRLRAALENYYEAYGHETDVSIAIPRGIYVTRFARCRVSVQGSLGLAVSDGDVRQQPADLPAEGDFAAKAPWLAALRRARFVQPTVVCVAAGVVAAGWLQGRLPFTLLPTICVTFTARDPDMRSEASLTRDMLLTALAQFRTSRVSVERLKSEASADYRLDIRYYADSDDRAVWWQLVDGRSGDLLNAGADEVAADGKSAAQVRNDIAAIVASRLAARKGLISTLEMRNAPDGALGNVCVLRAEGALEDFDRMGGANARRCLERTLAMDPKDSDATATLSRVVAFEGDSDAISRSIQLAAQAAAADPLSDRGQMAMARAQWAGGRVDAALVSANRALALNPNNPDVAGTLAELLFSAGYWQAASDMAEDAGRLPQLAPREASLVKALESFRKEEWSEASLLAEQVSRQDVVGQMLTVAALGKLGSEDAGRELAKLKETTPDFESSFRATMSARRYKPEITTSVEDGLRRAGARFAGEPIASAF